MKHGFTTGYKIARFYVIWCGMKQRCYDKKAINYKNYGGRGIKIQWKDFDAFRKDMYKKYLNHVKKHGERKTTIERIDCDKSYSKDNCRWATYREQARNRRNTLLQKWKGRSFSILELAESVGMKQPTLAYRLRAGWNLKEALKTPVKSEHYRKKI